jgi:hypothetical protein
MLSSVPDLGLVVVFVPGCVTDVVVFSMPQCWRIWVCGPAEGAIQVFSYDCRLCVGTPVATALRVRIRSDATTITASFTGAWSNRIARRIASKQTSSISAGEKPRSGYRLWTVRRTPRGRGTPLHVDSAPCR